MSQDAVITGSPIAVNLDGEEYFLSPLTDKDMVELDEWVKSSIIEMAERIATKLPGPRGDRLIQEALKTALSSSWMSGEGIKIMQSLEGVTRLIWQSLRKKHPDLKIETLKKMMMNPVNLARAKERFGRANSMEKRGPQTEASPTASSGPAA